MLRGNDSLCSSPINLDLVTLSELWLTVGATASADCVFKTGVMDGENLDLLCNGVTAVAL